MRKAILRRGIGFSAAAGCLWLGWSAQQDANRFPDATIIAVASGLFYGLGICLFALSSGVLDWLLDA